MLEYREGFNLFDRKGNGTIDTESVGDLLRALGQNPTNAEVEQLTAQADPTGSRSIGFDTFLRILLRPDGFRPAGTYDEFVNGFKVLGEKLSDAEMDELLKGVTVDKTGRVNYEGKYFVRMISSS
ncbi:hypothetical protein CPC16_000852 [Podila verticillata]|nr:hypothetical protein CPC16_000852 [Podila verticillata]